MQKENWYIHQVIIFFLLSPRSLSPLHVADESMKENIFGTYMFRLQNPWLVYSPKVHTDQLFILSASFQKQKMIQKTWSLYKGSPLTKTHTHSDNLATYLYNKEFTTDLRNLYATVWMLTVDVRITETL